MNASQQPFIVGLGGTTQSNSSTEKALKVSLKHAAQAGARTELISGNFLATLPLFSPEKPERSSEQQSFIETIRKADGLILATPAYHAGMSGLLKNAIDLFEDLRDDKRPYLENRAVGCIVTAFGWQGGGATLISVRTIVHALRGWPTPLGVTLNTAEKVFAADGACNDPKAESQLQLLADQVMKFAQRMG